jgi:hypothetical protein
MSAELSTIQTETLERMLKHESKQYYKATQKAEAHSKLCDDYWDELKLREAKEQG